MPNKTENELNFTDSQKMDIAKNKSQFKVVIFHKDHPFSPKGIHSGAEMGTIHLGRALARLGYGVKIFGRITSGSGIYDDVEYLDLGNSYNFSDAINQLKEQEIDLFISVTRVDVLLEAKKHNNFHKTALWLQDSALEETRGTVEQINHAADFIIYVSNVLREHLEIQGIDPKLGTVINNGFDNGIFYPRGKSYNKNRMVFAGALVPEKGINLLLDAFNIISIKSPDLELWLYGSESLWGYQQFYNKNSICFNNPKIHFAGKVTQPQLAEAFSNSAITVIPSLASKRLDPFPLISIEAQASGCPVIVTRCGGLPEGVINGGSGFILENEDPVELAAILTAYFDKNNNQDEFRRNAREHAEKNYNWDKIAETFITSSKNFQRNTSTLNTILEKKKQANKKLLFITQQLPLYDRNGGDFRTYRILKQLSANGHEVDLIARDTSPDYFTNITEAERQKYLDDYSKNNIKVNFLNHIYLDSSGKQNKIAINKLDDLLSFKKYDGVVITWWNIALEFIPSVRRYQPNATLIVDSVDVAFLRTLRFAALSDTNENWLEGNYVKQKELEAYKKADVVLTVTEDDKDALINEMPNAKVHVVTNVHPIGQSVNNYSKRKDLLFVGYFKHKPNEDAAKYLVKEIFPIIQKKIPSIKLYIVGNAPSKEIKELQNESIVVTGFVEDLNPYWQNCRLSVAPLRYGAGFKGKVGQSMAEGLPVVTTQIGVEGMGLNIGEEVLFSDNPVEFAELVIKAYNDEKLWSKLSINGIKKVKENWSDEIVAKRFEESLENDKNSYSNKIKNEKVVKESEYYYLVSKGYFWMFYKLFASAKEIFTEAIEKYPQYVNAYIGLAKTYYSLEKYKEAYKTLLPCADHQNLNSTYYELLGLLNNKFNKSEEAYKNFVSAVNINEKNSNAQMEIGNYLFDKKLYKQSIQYYSSSVQNGNKNLDMLENIAKILLLNGSYGEAIKILYTASMIAGSKNEIRKTNYLLNKISNIEHIKNINYSPTSFNESNILVSIIIPTFNKIEFTKGCIEAIQKNTNSSISHEIIIVDNASQDETVSYLAQISKEIRISLKAISLDKNLGFAKANNLGSEFARGKYLLFLNNDTKPQPNWLKNLLAVIENDEKVAAVGSKLLFPDGKIQHAGVAIIDDRKTPDPLLAYHLYWKSESHLKDANIRKSYQALTAACLLVRKRSFEFVEGFDEGYWNGYEDVDLCFKLREQNEFLIYVPESELIHYESQSGPERFSKVKENISLLHKKWLDKIKPDFIVEQGGSTIISDSNQIKIYNRDEVNTDNIITNDYKPLTSILVLTHNQFAYTKAFIDSVFQFTSVPFELIIVDNASYDDTVKYLEDLGKTDKRVKVIFNKENLGFPKGVNQALRIAEGNYSLMANNDIIVADGWLERMIEIAESDSSIGIVGPISNAVSGLQSDKDAKYNSIEGMHKYAFEIKEKNRNQIFEFPRVAFLCTLIKKEVIEKIGGLDERFSPGNFEDDDFCLRAQIAGYKTVIAKDVFIHHFGSKSFAADGVKKYEERLETNKKIFIEKWGADPEEIWLHGKKIKERNIMYPLNADDFSKSIETLQIFIEEKEFQAALRKINSLLVNFDPQKVQQHNISKVSLLNLAGNIALMMNDTDSAKNYFELALNEDKESSSACIGLAELFFIEENYEAAKTMYEFAFKLDPNNKNVVNKLEEVNSLLGNIGGKEIEVEKQNNIIEDQIRKNITIDSDNLVTEAYELFNKNKFNESLEKLFVAEKYFNGHLTNPTNVNFAAAFFNLKGFNYLGIDEIENARECFERALNLEPNSSEACAGLGEYFYMNNNNENAKIMFEFAVKNNPNNTFAAEELLKINSDLEADDASAFQDEDTEVRIKENLNQILNSVYELFQLKKYQEANDVLKNMEDLFYSQVEIENDLVSSYENLKGIVLLSLNKNNEAKEAFEAALVTNPNSSQACAGLGEVFFLSGKDKEAKTMYEWGVKNNPFNQFAMEGLIKVNKVLGLLENHNTLTILA